MSAAARTTFLPILVFQRLFVVELWANMRPTDDMTPNPQRHLYTLSLRLVLTIAIPCWLGRLGLLPTGISVC